MDKICFLLVPCYNEEPVLQTTFDALLKKLEDLIAAKKVSASSKIIFIDDGSTDNTWRMIGGFSQKTPLCGGIKLARNCGHEKALLAGLLWSKDKADITISLDADLQDDISVLPDFIEEYNKGNEIVYGIRKSRAKDSIFKKYPALTFYKLMRFLGIDIVPNHADYRLIGKKALCALDEYKENNLFLRGVIKSLGFKNSYVYYTRHRRAAGETKYGFCKLFMLAVEAVSSFSIIPIRFITACGFLMFLVSLALLVYYISSKYMGRTPPGYSSIVCSIWMLGGLQLLSIGIIGEYIGKTYMESKQRPRFIIEETL